MSAPSLLEVMLGRAEKAPELEVPLPPHATAVVRGADAGIDEEAHGPLQDGRAIDGLSMPLFIEYEDAAGDADELRRVARAAARLIDADGAISPEEFEFARSLQEAIQKLPGL